MPGRFSKPAWFGSSERSRSSWLSSLGLEGVEADHETYSSNELDDSSRSFESTSGEGAAERRDDVTRSGFAYSTRHKDRIASYGSEAVVAKFKIRGHRRSRGQVGSRCLSISPSERRKHQGTRREKKSAIFAELHRLIGTPCSSGVKWCSV